jgi:hypothetical protein
MLVRERKCYEVTEKGVIGEGRDKGKTFYLSDHPVQSAHLAFADYLLSFLIG